MKQYLCTVHDKDGTEVARFTEMIEYLSFDEWFYFTALDFLKPNGREVRFFINDQQVYVDGTPMKDQHKSK